MLIIISLLIGGIAVGYLLRNRGIGTVAGRAVTALVWLLLFLLGAEAGGNEAVTSGLASLGRDALAISLFATGGSVAAAALLWRFASRGGRKGGGGR